MNRMVLHEFVEGLDWAINSGANWTMGKGLSWDNGHG